MPEIQFASGLLARLHAEGSVRYDERAYLFVLGAIEFLQGRLERRRHVSGPELAWACRDLALERFGVLARSVLAHWGVKSTADFGQIVFALIRVGLLSSEPGDRIEDFSDVYDFGPALDESYSLGWTAEGQ